MVGSDVHITQGDQYNHWISTAIIVCLTNDVAFFYRYICTSGFNIDFQAKWPSSNEDQPFNLNLILISKVQLQDLITTEVVFGLFWI